MNPASPFKRFAGIAGAMLVAFVFLVPVASAHDELAQTGRVLISIEGDVTLPAGEHADTVVVINGTATIQGEANTVVAIDGAADLAAARVETVIGIRSPVTLGAGTVVLGDVRTLDAPVQRLGDAVVGGEVRDLSVDLVGIGAILAPALLLFTIGFALATIAAGLGLAALAARQVRAAEGVISREPMAALVVGLLGLIILPVLAVLAIVTVVGAPLGIAVLMGLWPLTAFIGYLVAGIWIGEWLLGRFSPGAVRERPYLAAVLGLLLLQILAIVPLVTAIASIFGFGAVTIVAWRTIRRGPADSTASRQALATPAAA